MPGCVQSGTGFPDGQAFEKCVPEFAFGMGRSFPLRCFAESASHSGRSKWDTLSQRRSNGKLRPIIRSRNGMHFPNESKTGKCIPQSALKVGRRFPMRLKRKMHPGICAQSGMRFPVEGLRGKWGPRTKSRTQSGSRRESDVYERGARGDSLGVPPERPVRPRVNANIKRASYTNVKIQ